jgi:hypothetical protein
LQLFQRSEWLRVDEKLKFFSYLTCNDARAGGANRQIRTDISGLDSYRLCLCRVPWSTYFSLLQKKRYDNG